MVKKGQKGIPITKETKLKISKANKGIVKSKEWRKKLSNSLKGRKHSPERIQAIINGLKKSKIQTRKTLPEKIVENAYGYLKYTGNKKLWLTFKNGKKKNPDFIIPGFKIAVEVFGDYWHKNDNPEELINLYNEIGWRCLVLWESNIKKDKTILTDIIDEFINYDNYLICPTNKNYGINEV